MQFYEIQAYLLDQLSKKKDPINVIHKLLNHIKNDNNEKVIKKLLKLDYKQDIKNFQYSITEVLKINSPDIKVKGYWFGIFDGLKNDREIVQSYICGSHRAPTNDESSDWAVSPKYFPENRFLKSKVLEKLPAIGNPTNDFGILYFPMWYVSIVIADYCKRNYKRLLNTNKSVIAVGFDSGDFLNLGSITAKGFDLSKFKIRKPKSLRKTETLHKYYAVNPNRTNAWFLDISNEDLFGGFASNGKPLKKKINYSANASMGLNSYPVDYTEDAFGNPIISKKLLEILIPYNKDKCFEYVEIDIENNEDLKYYLFNILSFNKCLNVKQTSWLMNNYARKMVFDQDKIASKNIFRLKSKDIHHYFYISANVKDELEANGITGLTLIPIDTI